MELRKITFSALVLSLLLACASLSFSQETHAKHDAPVTAATPSNTKGSLLDFSLHQINSTDRDYGWCIAQDRAVLLSETIDNRYFWSNIICLGLMAGLFLVILFQHKRHARIKWRLAETIAQYGHALSRAQRQVEKATCRNDDLMRFISEIEEPIPQPTARREIPASAVVENGKQSAPNRDVSRPTIAANSPEKTQKTAEVVRSNSKARMATAQIGLFNEGDVVMKINSQEHQITELRGQVSLLRGQLTESEQKLRTEKDRNRALKGA